MHALNYILPVLLSTFIGWAVIAMVIKMLFHPRRPVRILGMTIQGIYPGKQEWIAEQLGQVVSRELLSFDEIEKKITNPENLEKLKPEIEAHIDSFLRTRLTEQFPFLSMFVGDKTINQLKAAFLAELESLFPILMKSYMDKLAQDINLEKIVKEKITGFSSGKLEQTLLQSIKKELLLLKLAGALLGFLVGLLQVLIINSLT